jgi:hypothetical protein
MYKIKLACEGVPQKVGPAAALDITREFAFRPWQTYAHCSWDGSLLLLELENDYDENGLASQDEFSDAISACIVESFDGDVRIVSISPA